VVFAEARRLHHRAGLVFVGIGRQRGPGLGKHLVLEKIPPWRRQTDSATRKPREWLPAAAPCAGLTRAWRSGRHRDASLSGMDGWDKPGHDSNLGQDNGYCSSTSLPRAYSQRRSLERNDMPSRFSPSALSGMTSARTSRTV